MSQNSQEVIIEPLRVEEEGAAWRPVVGPETNSLLESRIKDERVRAAVKESAVSILSRATPPNGPRSAETGLVVGYVQSGKTLSLTAVAALARDNGYQIIIVVTGTSIQLFQQSTERLRNDLQIRPDRLRSWALFENPQNSDSMRGNIQRILDEWRDPDVPMDQRQSVLITVMKHHVHLNNLTDLLQSLDLKDISAIVVDDEADQASLNNDAPQGSQSTTYRRLIELKETLPSHTLLQYTATPQAPLLINIIDVMSPNFVQVLKPGETYTGGKDFFQPGSPYVRPIPPDEVPTNANALLGPPSSLLEAMRIFMIGVAAGLLKSGPVGCRSMLVHPSHRTAQHQEFYGWIQETFGTWARDFALPDDDEDKQELLAEFRAAYADLATTVSDLPPFNDVAKALRRAFNRTHILEVNRREGKAVLVDWSRQYGWILVGGQAMDRGFTVEGLTVTYMPRGVGVGNADTVQQRARFFGHKKEYLGYCRVYMEEQTIQAFHDYVRHEEDIHRQLTEVQNSGGDLNQWKRAFVLSPSLRPCRSSVLEFDYMRGRVSDSWLSPQIVLANADTVRRNREIVNNFLGQLALTPDEGHSERSDVQRHERCSGVLLSRAIEELLVPFRLTGVTDSQRFTGMLLQLGLAIEANQQETCTVYRMSPGAVRKRHVDEDGQISNLFQGEAPTFPVEARGSVYPGDRAIRAIDEVTIQVHMLTLTQGEGDQRRDVVERVPVVAVYVPARLAEHWISQYQP